MTKMNTLKVDCNDIPCLLPQLHDSLNSLDFYSVTSDNNNKSCTQKTNTSLPSILTEDIEKSKRDNTAITIKKLKKKKKKEKKAKNVDIPLSSSIHKHKIQTEIGSLYFTHTTEDEQDEDTETEVSIIDKNNDTDYSEDEVDKSLEDYTLDNLRLQLQMFKEKSSSSIITSSDNESSTRRSVRRCSMSSLLSGTSAITTNSAYPSVVTVTPIQRKNVEDKGNIDVAIPNDGEIINENDADTAQEDFALDQLQRQLQIFKGSCSSRKLSKEEINSGSSNSQSNNSQFENVTKRSINDNDIKSNNASKQDKQSNNASKQDKQALIAINKLRGGTSLIRNSKCLRRSSMGNIKNSTTSTSSTILGYDLASPLLKNSLDIKNATEIPANNTNTIHANCLNVEIETEQNVSTRPSTRRSHSRRSSMSELIKRDNKTNAKSTMPSRKNRRLRRSSMSEMTGNLDTKNCPSTHSSSNEDNCKSDYDYNYECNSSSRVKTPSRNNSERSGRKEQKQSDKNKARSKSVNSQKRRSKSTSRQKDDENHREGNRSHGSSFRLRSKDKNINRNNDKEKKVQGRQGKSMNTKTNTNGLDNVCHDRSCVNIASRDKSKAIVEHSQSYKVHTTTSTNKKIQSCSTMIRNQRKNGIQRSQSCRNEYSDSDDSMDIQEFTLPTRSSFRRGHNSESSGNISRNSNSSGSSLEYNAATATRSKIRRRASISNMVSKRNSSTRDLEHRKENNNNNDAHHSRSIPMRSNDDVIDCSNNRISISDRETKDKRTNLHRSCSGRRSMGKAKSIRKVRRTNTNDF